MRSSGGGRAAVAAAAARPRLVYLPFRAMAETSRMLLAHGGIDYEDEAIWGAEFHQRKLSGAFPWGKTPVIELPVPTTATVTFGSPFPETRVVTPSTPLTGPPPAPGSVRNGR
jgi:hypothetical protein